MTNQGNSIILSKLTLVSTNLKLFYINRRKLTVLFGMALLNGRGGAASKLDIHNSKLDALCAKNEKV